MNPINDQESFDFSKYRAPQGIAAIEPDIQQVHDESPFDFNKYRRKSEPTKLEEFGRHAARAGARVAETVAGFPGDVVGFVKFLSEQMPETPKIFKREPNLLQRKGREYLEKLPSSQQLKEVSSYLTSGFTDPQGAMEEFGDDVTSLATSLIIPAKDPTKFKSLLKAIGTATAVKSAGRGARTLGGGPKTEAAVELGTLMLTGFLGKKMAEKFVSEQFQEARSKIPQGTMVNTQNLENSLINLEQDLSKGISTGTKNEVKGAISELRAKAAGGAMEADEIIESYHNLNERLTSKKLFDELGTSERKILKHRYDKFKYEISKEVSKYGESNPEFIKQWREANQAYATIAQSKQVSNFLQSKLGALPKHLVGSAAVELFFGHPKVAASIAGSAGAVKTGELLYRIAKSPKLREHYMKVLLEATNENLPAVIKNIDALDKASKDLNQ